MKLEGGPTLDSNSAIAYLTTNNEMDTLHYFSFLAVALMLQCCVRLSPVFRLYGMYCG